MRRIAGTLVSLFLLIPAAASAWVTSLNGSAVPALDAANAVTSDPQGSAIAVGRLEEADLGDVFAVAKLRPGNGALAWLETFGAGEAFAVATDASGHIFAAGALEGGDGTLDLAVVKLSTAGATLWSRSIEGNGDGDDQALALAIDADGHVLVAGALHEGGTRRDFAVLKLDGESGATLWSRSIDHARLDDEARAVTLNSSDEVAVAGVFTDASQAQEFGVALLANATGATLWTSAIDGGVGGADEASFVEADTVGGVFAGGFETGPAGRLFTVRKYRRQTGIPFWTFHAGEPGDEVLAMDLEPAGNILATGILSGSFGILKVRSSDGTERWSSTVSSVPGSRGTAVTVAANGDVFVAGVENDDLLISRRKRINGTLLWAQTQGGSGGGLDAPTGIALDPDEDVLVAAVLDNGATRDDFAVLKRAGADGADFVPEPGGVLAAGSLLAGLLALRRSRRRAPRSRRARRA